MGLPFFFFWLRGCFSARWLCGEVQKGTQLTSKQAQVHPTGVREFFFLNRTSFFFFFFFFLSNICFSNIRSPAVFCAHLLVLNTGRQHLIVVFLRVLKHLKCIQAWGQCPGSVSFLPRRKPVLVVPRESLSQGRIPEILKFCLKEGRNVAQTLFITPVFQQP